MTKKSIVPIITVLTAVKITMTVTMIRKSIVLRVTVLTATTMIAITRITATTARATTRAALAPGGQRRRAARLKMTTAMTMPAAAMEETATSALQWHSTLTSWQPPLSSSARLSAFPTRQRRSGRRAPGRRLKLFQSLPHACRQT